MEWPRHMFLSTATVTFAERFNLLSNVLPLATERKVKRKRMPAFSYSFQSSQQSPVESHNCVTETVIRLNHFTHNYSIVGQGMPGQWVMNMQSHFIATGGWVNGFIYSLRWALDYTISRYHRGVKKIPSMLWMSAVSFLLVSQIFSARRL